MTRLRPRRGFPSGSPPCRRRYGPALLLILAAAGRAAPSPCQDAYGDSAWLSLGGESGQQVTFERGGGAVDLGLRQFAYHPGQDGDGGFPGPGFGHEYAIYDLGHPRSGTAGPGSQPSTNGHLHRLYLPLNFDGWPGGGWRLRLQPALAVSSNFLKSPDRIGLEAMQANAALLKSFRLNARAGWQAGLCADHRFGEYRLYPSLAWTWQAGGWSLRVGFPDSLLSRRLSAGLETSLGLSPAGNRWRVHDEALGDSWFSHEAWRMRWTLDWRFAPAWSLQVQAGRLFDNRYEFLTGGGVRFASRTSAASRIGLRLRWHFRD